MTRFFYNDKAKLEKVAVLLQNALAKFSARDFDADNALLAALNGFTEAYKELGKSDRETQFLAMKAEWATAQKGINPLTFEKVAIRRSEMLSGVSFRLLHRAEQYLSDDLAEIETRLKDAETLVAQIIIAAFQAKLLPPVEELAKIKDPEAATPLWDTLAKDENIVIGQKRVQLLVHRFDALLIFCDLLQRL